jgi:hypothetical protein
MNSSSKPIRKEKRGKEEERKKEAAMHRPLPQEYPCS